MSVVETATFNELIIDIHRLTKQRWCIYQNNAIGCYGRIIRSHTILYSRKFDILDKNANSTVPRTIR